MADISGYWEFHRACPSEDMNINEVSDTGALLYSAINGRTINGNYNATTNAISFNDARPGQILYVSFYTGYVLLNEEGGPCAMAGTYQEAELIFEESGTDSDRDAAEAAPGITIPITTFHSAWYAIWTGPIIG